MAKSVPHFGLLPINPDNNIDGFPYGQGTEFPISFSRDTLLKMYWSVRSFKIDYAGFPPQQDPLVSFLLGGGTSGTIIGSLAGLQSVANGFNGQSDIFSGYTKISGKFLQKLRKGKRSGSNEEIDLYSFEGIQKSKTQTQIKPNKTTAKTIINNSIYEGNLFSLGTIHSATGIVIDFSNILFRKNLYWPRIVVSGKVFSSLSTQGATPALGGINFIGGGVINMFLKSDFLDLALSPYPAIINGTIQIGNRCYDRFFYDSFDKERRDEKKCDGWQNIPESNF